MKTKLKLPKLLRFKSKKLRAATSRRPLRIAAAATDYEEMAEPNMKLSRALLIVLLLHVIAVTGIIAFNAIKTRQSSVSPAAASAANTANPTVALTGKSAASALPVAIGQKGSTKSLPRDGSKIDRAKTNDSTTPASPNKVYVVAKGDNPVTIAKKFKVSYDELVALNHIDDPRKLQIGQKLLIPAKTAKGKKSDE
jgi:LysM repeat protein